MNRENGIVLIPKKWAVRWLIVFSLLLAAVMSYIFYNSMQNAEESAKQSAVVVDQLKPIVGIDEGEDAEGFGDLVRKLAHVFEFALLGLCIGGLLAGFHVLTGRLYVGAALFWALLVGVADEFIQSFTGRGSMVSDVLIDFSGALIGLLPMAVCFVVRSLVLRKHSR